jgi:hypothetical protein
MNKLRYGTKSGPIDCSSMDAWVFANVLCLQVWGTEYLKHYISLIPVKVLCFPHRLPEYNARKACRILWTRLCSHCYSISPELFCCCSYKQRNCPVLTVCGPLCQKIRDSVILTHVLVTRRNRPDHMSRLYFLLACTLKMEAVRSSEKTVNFCQTKVRHHRRGCMLYQTC